MFAMSTDAATSPRTDASSFKVLLIEDSPTVRGYLRTWLRTELPHAEILEAEDGKAAFHLLGRNLVQLIITDLNMPGMDGLTFLDKLRSNSVLKKKPVIVLSGSLTDELRQSTAADPLLCLLTKPASITQLSQALSDLLARTGRPAAARS
jgi:two-component system chemotaxis response regulator CheY